MFSFFKFQKENGKSGIPLLLLLALGGLGLFLLLGGNVFSSQQEQEAPLATTSPQEEILTYQAYLESRIESLCSQVEGAGKVRAMVTLEGGFASHYATEIKDGNTSYILVGSGSHETGLFLSHVAPGIMGIGVVCTGGDDIRVQEELTQLLSAALGVPTNRIHIAKSV